MTLLWPPKSLGLGTPLNLAVLSARTRPLLTRDAWLAPVIGVAVAFTIVAADRMLFGGATMAGTPDLSSHPPIGNRILVAVIGSLGEEVVFRVGVATLAGWVIYWLLRAVLADPRIPAQLAGAVVAALCVGVMHVGQVGQPSEFWRVMTVNVMGHAVYGWLYWRRGFEMAVLTHMIVTAILYIGLPAVR